MFIRFEIVTSSLTGSKKRYFCSENTGIFTEFAMARNRTVTLASLSPIPYRCDICKFAQKNKGTFNAKRRGNPNDRDLQVFFQTFF